MRRNSARVRQLREHLHRRRHDAQAKALLARLQPPRPPATLDGFACVLSQYYNGRYFRRLRKQASLRLYRFDELKKEDVSGLEAWLPKSDEK